MRAATDSNKYPAGVLFPLFFLALFALHAPLLRLPYFWDEAGYYVPAARDLFLTGSLIPHSTPSNAHPPLVLAAVALGWKIFGFAVVVTRTVMLSIAAFTLLGVFRLAQRVANTEVAIATAICTALYPVFFSQSSLAHVDLAAAGLTLWGILAYVERRPLTTAVFFSFAALAKETAVLAPLALVGWEISSSVLQRRGQLNSSRIASTHNPTEVGPCPIRLVLALVFPLIPIAAWFAYHYRQTGFVFGNPEFFRYNVQATLQPLRILLALGLRLWQVFGYFNLFILTLATLGAMLRPPLRDENEARPRIAIPVQLAFASVIGAYVTALAVVGGAELARYMLPAIPLVIMIGVSTLWRRVRRWRELVALVAMGFAAGLFVNPPHGFAMEDNLAYRDYIRLHQGAETFLEARYPMARVLTAWPASDELSQPYLGYVTRPMRVVRIEDFTAGQLLSANNLRSQIGVALVFSTKYEPPHAWFESWQAWQQWKTEFFGYHRDVPPVATAQILGGRLVYEQHRNNQWVGIIEMEKVEDAYITSRRGNARYPFE